MGKRFGYPRNEQARRDLIAQGQRKAADVIGGDEQTVRDVIASMPDAEKYRGGTVTVTGAGVTRTEIEVASGGQSIDFTLTNLFDTFVASNANVRSSFLAGLGSTGLTASYSLQWQPGGNERLVRLSFAGIQSFSIQSVSVSFGANIPATAFTFRAQTVSVGSAINITNVTTND